MKVGTAIFAFVLSYLLGSVPVGLLLVKLLRGRDIRYWFSGRTGGTNVMRMAGFWAGFTTGLMDLFKGALAVYISGSLLGGNEWIEVGAGLLAILGHNYSIFLIERKEGVLRLRGGAGGATATGVVLGLWPPALLFIIPISIFLLYVVGYASLGTLSIGLMTIGIFSFRAAIGEGPWAYAAFGVCTLGLLVWALRPNIRRLLKGEERLVGWRAQRKVPQEEPEIQNRT